MAEAGGGLMYVGSRGAWYPNRGLAMSDYDLEFRYPAQWTLVATGHLVSQSQAAGEHIERYVSDRPLPLAGFNLGKYVKEDTRLGSAEIATYAAAGMESTFPRQRAAVMVLPDIKHPTTGMPEISTSSTPNPSRNARIITERAARDVDFLAHRLGPFPYSSLSLTQMPGRDSSGWPGLIFLSSYVFLSPEERTQARVGPWGNLLYGDVMQTHETVHQWIGDLIIWRSYREQWIVEALSNYVALLKLEQERPADVATVLNHYRDELLARNRDGIETTEAGPVTLGVRLDSSRFPDGYEAISYGRGTWLFHMLRHMLLENPEARAKHLQPGPDEPFFQALRKIRDKFEGREITTRDLQQAFEEYLPDSLKYEGRKSLDWFFDTWVNGTSIPRVDLDDVKMTTPKSKAGAPLSRADASDRVGTMVATGKLRQTNAPDTLVTSVPLYNERGEFIARVFAEGPESTFRVRVPSGTKRLVLDPNGTVLRRK
jgi:Peptidase family M1 domain